MNTDDLTAILASEPDTNDRIGQPMPMRPRDKYRDIQSEWDVMEGHTDPDRMQYGEPGRIVLDLTTAHYASRKEFVSTLRVSIVGDGMRQTTMAFGSKGESVTVARAPAGPRFSAKSMRAHHVEALTLTRLHAATFAAGVIGGVRQYLPSIPA